METNEHRPEEQFEQFLGHVLRIGVLLAAAVVLFGGVLLVARHAKQPLDHKTFHGEPDELRDPAKIVGRAMQLDDRGMIMLGLLLLVATPVARVVFSVIAFARERDYLYVTLTLIVLGALLYSLFAGVFHSQTP
jgi:uncharacterized membrane protein